MTEHCAHGTRCGMVLGGGGLFVGGVKKGKGLGNDLSQVIRFKPNLAKDGVEKVGVAWHLEKGGNGGGGGSGGS